MNRQHYIFTHVGISEYCSNDSMSFEGYENIKWYIDSDFSNTNNFIKDLYVILASNYNADSIAISMSNYKFDAVPTDLINVPCNVLIGNSNCDRTYITDKIFDTDINAAKLSFIYLDNAAINKILDVINSMNDFRYMCFSDFIDTIKTYMDVKYIDLKENEI